MGNNLARLHQARRTTAEHAFRKRSNSAGRPLLRIVGTTSLKSQRLCGLHADTTVVSGRVQKANGASSRFRPGKNDGAISSYSGPRHPGNFGRYQAAKAILREVLRGRKRKLWMWSIKKSNFLFERRRRATARRFTEPQSSITATAAAAEPRHGSCLAVFACSCTKLDLMSPRKISAVQS